MTAPALLAELADLGVELWVEGDRLRFRAPAGALTPALRTRLGVEREALLARLAGERPLAASQERFWFLQLLEPGSPAYNIPACIDLRGPLSTPALAAALTALAARHEALRTRCEERDGRPVGRVEPPAPLAPPVVDLGALAPPRSAAEAGRLAGEGARRPFDLAAVPHLRPTLLRLGPSEHRLLLTSHHFAADGWSMRILLGELGALYGAAVAEISAALPAPVPFADHARRERSALAAGALADQLAYWHERLAGAPPPLELPADRPTGSAPAPRGATLRWRLPADLVARLHALGGERGATLFMVLVAGFKALLHRLTGERDLVVATAISHRHRPELERVVGPLSNTLALRTDLGGDPSFRALLERVAATARGAYAHADLPFDRLVESLRPDARSAHAPFSRLFLVLQATPLSTWTLPGLAVRLVPVDTGAAKFDLSLSLEETADGLVGSAEYDAGRFERTTVRRLLGHLETLLAAAAVGAERPLSALPLLTAAERHQLVVEENDTATAYPREATVVELVAARVARAPAAVAVEWGEERLTYGELAARAGDWAAELRRRGVGPETVVGLCLDRGPELVTAMLAVAAAGGAYLPLDPDYPPARLALMIADAGARVVIAAGRYRPRLPADAPVVTPAELGAGGAGGAGLASAALPEALAYVLYTSGSTGRPKGVAVPHRAVVRLVAHTDYAQLGPGDAVAQAATASFDAATFEVWGALANGARLVGFDRETTLAPAHFAAELSRRGVTALFLTTALFNQLAREAPEAFAGLDHLLFGGEACDATAVRRALAAAPRRLLHVYGPTETTTFATWQRVTEVPAGATTVPIGRPIANSTLFLLDARLQPVPLGVEGEVYLGGDGVARGYLGGPAATAARFVPAPFPVAPGARLYRTGDRARRRPDGAVEFLGRLDAQVKIRGFRVEPGEVEAALAACPGVAQAAVVVREDRPGQPRLVAYAVPCGAPRPDPAGLLRLLGERLPAHLVPAAAVVLDRLPLTPAGKVDRRALPEPPAAQGEAERSDEVAGADPVSELVATAWAEVLGIERVRRGDDFFALGGHSLLAARVAARVRARLGVAPPLRDLFEAPELAAYAARVAAALAGPRRAALPAIEPRSVAGELPLSYAQERLWFLDRLEGPSATYNVPVGLRLRGPLAAGALAGALAAVARRHEALRTRFAFGAAGPVQVVEAAGGNFLPQVDLAGLGGRAEGEARRLAGVEARRPFDLARAPHLRAALLRLADGDCALVATVHHVAADGGSVELLLRELGALYRAARRGRPSPLAPPALQVADFALWQRRWLDASALAGPLAYWRERLAGLGSLPLPTDRPRPGKPSFRGVRRVRRLPAGPTSRLRASARAAGATPFMVLLAVYQTLLSRWSGETDVAVGTPVAARPRPELEGVVGFFANTLVLRTDLAGNPSFAALVERVRETCLGAFTHQEVPFEKLVEALQPAREVGRTPLFQALFVFQAAPALRLDLGDVAAEPFGVDPGVARFDLTLSATLTGDDGLVLAVDAGGDLFDAATVERALDRFTRLLTAALDDPRRSVETLPIVSPAERQQLLVEWSGEAGGGPLAEAEEGADRGFWRLAERRGDLPALIAADGERWSYRELAAAAAGFAGRLRALGVGPEAVVGVALERSPAALAALLGVMAAGGVYLPLDPEHPRERRAELLADAGARVLVTAERGDRPTAPGVVEVPPPGRSEAAVEPAAPAPNLSPERLAYVFYTSGSTGRPKGVAVAHRALAGTLAWRRAAFAPGVEDRVLQSVPLTFDPSLWQILGALTGGAALVLPRRHQDPAHLSEVMARERVTVADFPPSLLTALLAAGGLSHPELRLVFAGGEALAPGLAVAFAEAAPQARLVNIYGPTETAIDAACWSCRSERGAAVPIGRPVAGKRLWVVDRHGEPVAAGTVGELLIGGAGLARGYLHRPAATAGLFLPDPWSGVAGARLYRSGDLVRHRADGALEFVGRADRQVKLRGQRLEPGEVEAVLRTHPQVEEATVGVWTAAPGDDRLVAWVTARAGAAPPEPSALRTFCGERLPPHALPAAFVRLAALPRTASGKLDRRALPAPAAGDEARRAAFVPPRGEVERAIAEVWRGLLRVDAVGLDDNFFELGGHSLLMVAARERLVERLGRADLALMDLFQYPTVGALARRLGGGAPAPAGGDGEARRRAGRERQAARLAMRRAVAG